MRKAFISGHEVWRDAQGQPKGLRFAVTVWEGDERDPPGMRDLGTRIIEVASPINYGVLRATCVQAAKDIAGIEPKEKMDMVHALQQDLSKVVL